MVKWQTHCLQEAALARAWEFKSPLGHEKVDLAQRTLIFDSYDIEQSHILTENITDFEDERLTMKPPDSILMTEVFVYRREFYFTP